MKLDLGSFAFGSFVSSGGNTPSWGTSLGQKKPDLKLTYPGYDNIVIGMMYKSIPVDKVFIPLGKGGHVCNSLEDEGIQLAAMFDKVYINEVKVNAPFIMLIYQDSSDSWAGRKTLKYNVKIEYHRGQNDIVYNSEFVDAAQDALQLDDNACWVVSDIYIVNQDELHLVAGIVNPHKSETYATSELRKVAFLDAIKTTYEENPHFAKKYSDESLCKVSEFQNSLSSTPHQQIFYGAPGTGKSNTIKRETEGKEVIRTTFHPDSDYSTFVGCYKPTKGDVQRDDYSVSELKLLYKEFCKTNPSRKEIRFGGRYFASIASKNNDELKQIFEGSAENMVIYEVPKAIAAAQAFAEAQEKTSAAITYSFVPQAFTKAYIRAWNVPEENVYLVIEEINRGNCAQIFGDLFQLLDRKDGVSEYPIKADEDLRHYLEGELGVDGDGIKNGELCLPANLYIWATMNTSDQSLFPIDSAFKRRWDWKYVPIKNEEKGWKIDLGNGEERDWWEFLIRINEEIERLTQSEDKKMGYWFVKCDDGKISLETFKDKVLFYLWNDVLKDYGTTGDGVFKGVKFHEFYEEDGNQKVRDLLDRLFGKQTDEETA